MVSFSSMFWKFLHVIWLTSLVWGWNKESRLGRECGWGEPLTYEQEMKTWKKKKEKDLISFIYFVQCSLDFSLEQTLNISTRSHYYHLDDQGFNIGILLGYQDQTVAQLGTLGIQQVEVCDTLWFSFGLLACFIRIMPSRLGHVVVRSRPIHFKFLKIIYNMHKPTSAVALLSLFFLCKEYHQSLTIRKH